MFRKLIGSFLLPTGSYVVLRINNKGEYVTHQVGSVALEMSRNEHANEMDALLNAEGDHGHYFMDNLRSAMKDFSKRIDDAMSCISYTKYL